MKRIKLLSVSILLFVFAFICVFALSIVDEVVPSTVRDALPDSARDIKEHYSGTGITDFIRLLKARLPEEDFILYVHDLGALQSFQEYARLIEINSSAAIDWTGTASGPEWWDPTSDLSEALISHNSNEETYTIVKYERGYVYLKILSW